jgi:hypothetical protein
LRADVVSRAADFAYPRAAERLISAYASIL